MQLERVKWQGEEALTPGRARSLQCGKCTVTQSPADSSRSSSSFHHNLDADRRPEQRRPWMLAVAPCRSPQTIRNTRNRVVHSDPIFDTTTPVGRSLFVSELESEMIVGRVNAILPRAKKAIDRDLHFIHQGGAPRRTRQGHWHLRTARLTGLGTGKLQRLKPATATSA